jgi:hypothetical protein
MAGISRMGIALGFVFLSACATARQYVEVGGVVTEVRQDEVAATAKYRDRTTGLRGRVIDKGMKSSKAAQTQGATGFGTWSSKTVMINKNYGYVVLESVTNRASVAICLFEPDMLENLAPVQKGQIVNLSGVFSMVVGKKGERAPVFYACAVDS